MRATDKEVRQLARPYLRDLYTKPDGEIICQACHLGMPFRLEDGTPYFEAPELLQSSSAELAENHLALCPTCLGFRVVDVFRFSGQSAITISAVIGMSTSTMGASATA